MSTAALSNPPHDEAVNGFVLLAPRDLKRLMDDEGAQETYGSALLLMEDLVCELWDEPSHSRFDAPEWDRQTRMLLESFGGADSLSRNVQENLALARELRRRSELPRTAAGAAHLRAEATRFMRSLLFTYDQVRMLR